MPTQDLAAAYRGAAMRLRLLAAFAVAGWGAVPASFAQQITSDVVVSGASINDGYTNASCDEAGQLYRSPINVRPDGRPVSVMRVGKDGSTVLFTLPQPDWSIQAMAPRADGLTVATNAGEGAERGATHVYRFDAQGKIQSQRTISSWWRWRKRSRARR